MLRRLRLLIKATGLLGVPPYRYPHFGPNWYSFNTIPYSNTISSDAISYSSNIGPYTDCGGMCCTLHPVGCLDAVQYAL